jgi:tetratricopeptide (TPR) repeat protein
MALNSEIAKFPLCGVKLSHLRTFKGEGRTTRAMVEAIFQPTVTEQRTSYCDLLKKREPTLVKDKADVFLSHAHDQLWDDVLESLSSEDGDVYVWVDICSLCNHNIQDFEVTQFFALFSNALNEIGRAWLVVVPWDSPLSPKRLWCGYEFATVLKNENIKWKICILPTDEQRYRQQLRSTLIEYERILQVNVARGGCGVIDDAPIILQQIQEIGIEKVNHHIMQPIREWLLSIALQEAQSVTAANEEAINIWQSLGLLYSVLGQYSLALPWFQKALETRCKLDDKVKAMLARRLVARCQQKLGREFEAEAEFNVILSYFKETNIPRELAISYSDLGWILHDRIHESYPADKRVDPQEAEVIFRKAITLHEQCDVTDETTKKHLLEDYYALGCVLLCKKGTHGDAAFQAFQKALQLAEDVLGKDSDDMAMARVHRGMGLWLARQKRFKEAEPHLVRNLNIRKTILGADHIQTGNIMILLANCLEGRRRQIEALLNDPANSENAKSLQEEIEELRTRETTLRQHGEKNLSKLPLDSPWRLVQEKFY